MNTIVPVERVADGLVGAAARHGALVRYASECRAAAAALLEDARAAEAAACRLRAQLDAGAA